MKSLLLQFAVLGLLAAALPARPAWAEFDRASSIRVAASVIKVEVIRAQGGYSIGSGVVVGDELVATNCHVTREARAVALVRGSQRWLVSAQAADIAHDVCVLRAPGLPLRAVASVDSRTLALGQPALALGYTGGIEMQHSSGDIVGLFPLDGARVIQLRNGFNSGASGGGLFDEQMRLVGILTFRLRGGASHYFAAPVEWLRPLLSDSDAFQPIAPLESKALAYWQQPAAAQPPFLQAAVLEREQRWDELDHLARQWGRSAPDDAQPVYARALALNGLQRWPESQAALERALRIEPAFQEAWFQLGLVHVAQGHTEAARLVLLRLQSQNSDRAAELESVLVTH